MPAPGEIVAAVVIGLVVLFLLRLVIAVPSWVRLGRRPETRAIRVVGIGGGGSNAVDRMVRAGLHGVSFVALNTDAQALRRSTADTKIRIGDGITGGLGSGGDPEVGRRAAEEDEKRIAGALAGADLVFVTAGLGGGTGSGAAPTVAENARKQGALTIAVVTKPFGFEGTQRKRIADEAAGALAQNVDALIVVPNDRVGEVLDEDAAMMDAFRLVDDVLLQAVQGIIDLITAPGLINLDFADIRSVMTDAGPTLIGLGRGSGENRAIDAARQAIASPLLEASIEGARGILFNVSGPSDLRLREVRQAADEIRERADADANVIFGASFSDTVADDVLITLIATGLNRLERETAPVRQDGDSEDTPATAAIAPGAPSVASPPPSLPIADARPTPPAAEDPPSRRSRRPAKEAPGSPSPHPVPAPLQHIRAHSSVHAEVRGDTPESSSTATDEDLEVPSFLRRRG